MLDGRHRCEVVLQRRICHVLLLPADRLTDGVLTLILTRVANERVSAIATLHQVRGHPLLHLVLHRGRHVIFNTATARVILLHRNALAGSAGFGARLGLVVARVRLVIDVAYQVLHLQRRVLAIADLVAHLKSTLSIVHRRCARADHAMVLAAANQVATSCVHI